MRDDLRNIKAARSNHYPKNHEWTPRNTNKILKIRGLQKSLTHQPGEMGFIRNSLKIRVYSCPFVVPIFYLGLQERSHNHLRSVARSLRIASIIFSSPFAYSMWIEIGTCFGNISVISLPTEGLTAPSPSGHAFQVFPSSL
jgi:hypothetical protein